MTYDLEWESLELTHRPVGHDGIELVLACGGVPQAACRARRQAGVLVVDDLCCYGERCGDGMVERLLREAALEWSRERLVC
jgi:hypothetical protein